MDSATQQHIRQVEDEWENLRDLFIKECNRLNRDASIRAEVVGPSENPDNDDVFWIVNARRDRKKPLLQFELRRDVPAIVCCDQWNSLPRQAYKFVFYGASVVLTGGSGAASPEDIVHNKMHAITQGLKT